MKSAFFRKNVVDGRLLGGELLPHDQWPEGLPAEGWKAVVEHPRIPFVSYPYEWPFSMLRDAALLQLDLLREALYEDFTSKDASSFNVQWQGARPVFIDLSSFERWEPGDPWAGYRQFCQMFLNPLLLESLRGVSARPWLRGRLEGLEPETCARLLRIRELARPAVFRHVWLHALFLRRFRHARQTRATLAGSGFTKDMILVNLEGLYRLVSSLRPRKERSDWSGYTLENSYSPEDREAKRGFVLEAVSSRRRPLIWDLGANTGEYSRLVAPHADYVVAMDADAASVESLYAGLQRDHVSNVLPLVLDLADPSPNQGWRQRERGSLTERDRPDLVLCLALLHHLIIGANVPISEVLGWLSQFGGELVIEFVGKADPMAQRLLQNKRDQYDDYTEERFELLLARSFLIRRKVTLSSGTRALYLAESRS